MVNKKTVFAFNSSTLLEEMGKSRQADYIIRYLSNPELDAKTVVVERNYIDKDYLMDYQTFYSRSFKEKKIY